MTISLARRWSLDHDAQSLTGEAERLFHLVLGVTFGEDKAQVAVALGQRADPLAQRDGNAEAGEAGGSRGFGAALDGPEHTGPRHGQHEHSRRPAVAVSGGGPPQRVGQYQLLQAGAAGKTQRT